MSSKSLVFALAIAAAATLGCGDSNKTIDGAPGDFTLEAVDLAGGQFSTSQIFNGFGCTGQNMSPTLRWSNPPAGTKSFVLTMFDPDAPTGSGFYHWTVFDLPATTTQLSANAAAGGLPTGAVQGYTDFGMSGYGGPCPPDGDLPHRYIFKLSALSVDHLGLTAGAPGALVTFSALGSTLGTATFMATYGRGTPGTTTHPDTPTRIGFTLTSDEIPANGTIGNDQVLNTFGCSGNNVSPTLRWAGAPPGTQSFILTMFDPDAPTGSGFWHWLVFDIPAAATSIAKGAGTAAATPAGGIQGYNDTGANAYAGPCPPAGDPPHHYIFTLYALPAATIGATATATGGLVGFSARATATAKATFTATYGR
jgi:Raf kinase inhibitor-like YbhB/YbcL family protein